MINLAKDPKGYYVALGVDENATADDIKTAFRSKAKRLHPDHNPSPIAAKQFHRVREAYETLTDPLRRAAYDRGWRTVSGGMGSGAGNSGANNRADTGSAQDRPPPKDPPPREEPKAGQREDTQPKSEPRRTNTAPAGEAAALCKCGKVTAQPRYIIFDVVVGKLRKVQRRGLSGVYCRTCADRTAIRASLTTWLAGWWAWPNGPRETIKAIVSNMRGGRRPAERNAKLLARQARAFRDRGEMQLARACAEQALPFATKPELRREIDGLLSSLSAHAARSIKDRWREPSLAVTIQALPLAVIVGATAMTLTLSADRSLTGVVASWFERTSTPALIAPDAESGRTGIGRVFAVTTNGLALRTGPSGDYQVTQLLAKDTLVLATEVDPGGRWVRVVLADRTSGFLPLSDLTPNVAVDALDALGGFERGQQADTPSGASVSE